MIDFSKMGLGRAEPPDHEHIDKFPFSDLYALMPHFTVEKSMPLPGWHKLHNQGAEGSCVGHGVAMMLAIMNIHQCSLQGAINPYIRYNPWWLWDRAKEKDSFAETNPGDSHGTTVRAACQVLHETGVVSWPDENDPKSIGSISRDAGIAAYRWARNVDEMRLAIHQNIPVAIGVRWYSTFDQPVYRDGEWFIGQNPLALGRSRGGHCVCVYGASDGRQAFRVKNSWGAEYPEVWLPYDTMDALLRSGGEASLITDL